MDTATTLVERLLAVGDSCKDTVACAKALVQHTGGTGLRKEREGACKARGVIYTAVCEELVLAGMVPPLLAALKAHKGHAECCQWLTHSCRNLQPSKAQSELSIQQLRAGGALEELVACLALHPDSEAVSTTTCGAITNLSCSGDAVALALVELGALEALMGVMQRHSGSARCIDMACGAVGNIVACEDKGPAKRAVKAGILPHLAAALRAHPHSALVVETVCYTLLYLTLLGEDVCNLCSAAPEGGGESILSLLLAALARARVPRALEMVCECIRNLGFCWVGGAPPASTRARRLQIVEHPLGVATLVRLYKWSLGEGQLQAPAAAAQSAAPPPPQAAGAGSAGSAGSSSLPEEEAYASEDEEGAMSAIGACVSECLSYLKYSTGGRFTGKGPSCCSGDPDALLALLRRGTADAAFFKLACKALARECAGRNAVRVRLLKQGAAGYLRARLPPAAGGAWPVEEGAAYAVTAHLHARIFRALAALAPGNAGAVLEALGGGAQGAVAALGGTLLPRPAQWASALLGLLAVGSADRARVISTANPGVLAALAAVLQRFAEGEGRDVEAAVAAAYALKCLGGAWEADSPACVAAAGAVEAALQQARSGGRAGLRLQLEAAKKELTRGHA